MRSFRLFKYTKAENAVKCFSKNSLWFARASSLNDPLETRFTSASPEEFMEVYQTALRGVSELTSEEFADLKKNISPDFATINDRENLALAEHCREMGILSLGQQPDHQAMWAYYAEDGEGVCLELCIDEEYLERHNLILSKVQYGTDLRPHNRAQDLAEIFLEISMDNPGLNHAEVFELSISTEARRSFGARTQTRAASRKHSHWAHENEIRLLHPGWGDRAELSTALHAVHIMKMSSAFFHDCVHLLRDKYAEVPIYIWEFDDNAMHMVRRDFHLR